MNLSDKKILLTGGNGFLGSFVKERLIAHGANEENIFTPTAEELNLVVWENCQKAVNNQDIVIHLAAKVGGIGFNREKPGELFYDNALMGIQMIEAARQAGVEKLVAIGTICAYPNNPPVPFKEEDLWSGYPEETNAPYGLAKKMMLVQSQAYRDQYGFNSIYLLPTNLYGPRDNFDPKNSHVIPALIRKVSEAMESNSDHIDVWGTGSASREFLYAEDAAEGIVLATERYDKSDPVNLGTGREVTIKETVETICRLMDFQGEIRWDSTKPDGQPRRQLDTARAKEGFGFEARISFEDGLKKAIEWYREAGGERN